MNHWLHFIGRQYYSERKFLEESRDLGCSRRVALQVLKQMSIGDRVYCALIRNGEKSPVVLGYFIIDRLSGLSIEMGCRVGARLSLDLQDFGGQTFRRGCGTYTTGPSYALGEVSLSDIVACIESEAAAAGEALDIGNLLIQGEWFPLDPVIRLRKVKFRPGYRRFDIEKALLESSRHPWGVAAGYYYVFSPLVHAPPHDEWPGGTVQVLEHYRQFT